MTYKKHLTLLCLRKCSHSNQIHTSHAFSLETVNVHTSMSKVFFERFGVVLAAG